MARFWDLLTGTAVLAFLVSGVLGAFSLLFLGIRFQAGQLLLAGIAEMLLSYVILAAGIGALYAAVREMRGSTEPVAARIAFIFCGLICGARWVILGVSGLVSPEIITRMLSA